MELKQNQLDFLITKRFEGFLIKNTPSSISFNDIPFSVPSGSATCPLNLYGTSVPSISQKIYLPFVSFTLKDAITLGLARIFMELKQNQLDFLITKTLKIWKLRWKTFATCQKLFRFKCATSMTTPHSLKTFKHFLPHLSDYEDFENLKTAMKKAGYSKNQIERIFYKNFNSFLSRL